MIKRGVATIWLVALLGLSLFVFAVEKPGSKAPASSAAAPATANPPALAAAPVADRQVIAYYFHGTVRCRTCLKLEATAADVLRERFRDDLEAKRLEWRVVDYDEPANEHFIRDYRLIAPSLVLVELRNGTQQRFKTLDRLWEYAHDEDRLNVYVRNEVLAFLRGANG